MATTFGRIFKDELKKSEQKPVETVETSENIEKEPIEKSEQKPTRKKNVTKE